MNLFPTPVSYTQGFLSKEEAKNFFDYCLTVENKEHNSVLGNGVSTHHSQSTLFEKAMDAGVISVDIYERLSKVVSDYAVLAGYKYSGIGNSWCNVQNSGSTLARHCHPGSIISGAFYLNADEKSSPICFHNPNPFIQFLGASSQAAHGYEWFQFLPKIGDLLLFPSWLTHSSGDHKNETVNRVVVSFNTF
jgi:uncharacterized protein (TIGR02466 family)